mmetsp:Transcript_2570/g.5654  ORF Transcript_2570/g.5654 Transcript_2570/m.5654 type:complete len:896 (+) Transcript_2570:110-2797(+)
MSIPPIDGAQPPEFRMNPKSDHFLHANDRRSSYGSETSSRHGHSRSGSSHRNRKGLLGLSNLGNTCFMNAALQCMSHTHGLQKYFRWCSHAYSGKSQSSRQKLVMAFAHWFESDWSKSISATYHSPEDILRAVQQVNPIFQGYVQQDSQELLRCVLDNMHEELRKEVPDDVAAYLRKHFGIENPSRLIGPAISSQSQASSSQALSDGKEKSAEEVVPTPSSGMGSKLQPTARQLMQLCQNTGGVTDAEEIRLPEVPSSPSKMKDASHSPKRKGVREKAASEESPDQNGAARATSSSSAAASSQEAGEEELKTHFTSIISELFQGRLESVVTCLECQRTSRTQEVIYDVSVPIPNSTDMNGHSGPPPAGSSPHSSSKGTSWSVFSGIPGKVKSWIYDKGVDITDCLQKYCAPEYLSGKDKYYCEHCKRKNDCEKRIVFKELPEVLCIHIKRFRYDAGWFDGRKNSKVVTFPVSKPLDLSGLLDEPSSQPMEYKLMGVIQHIGSMGGGHYISYCQHKRKPHDWYEFDDMQVSLVSAEQVERAEPYVLFFQRQSSKAHKQDRLNFKADRRRVEDQIRDFLVAQQTGESGRQAGATGAAQHAALQVVLEEMHQQGPMVRALYKSPPSDLDIVFVSKHWYVRLTTMSHPGPIDNHMYLCRHQLLGLSSPEMACEPFLPISRTLWQSLVAKYGGGPTIPSLELCPKCRLYLKAFNERKQQEFDLVTKHDTKDPGEGKYWYLVDATWVNNWKRYVRGDMATNVADAITPGQITNHRLFEKDGSKVRPELRLRNDYIGVNARVWWLFMHIHGGGPVICREELDIYSAECKAEEDLHLEELRAFEGMNLATRMSWQFVDECRGDISLFEQKYSKVLRKDQKRGSPDEREKALKSDLSETNGVML